MEVSMSQDEEYKRILKFVKDFREEYGIDELTPDDKWESSGGMHGEGKILLFRQLVYTPEGRGGWLELKDANVRNLVIKEIEKYQKSK